MRQFSLVCLVMSTVTLIVAICAPQNCLQVPEMVGYKACQHLMLRLVDCLVEACELYLHQSSAAGSLGPGDKLLHEHPPQGGLMGAIGPIFGLDDDDGDEDDESCYPEREEQLSSYLATTKPMNWLKSHLDMFGPSTTTAPITTTRATSDNLEPIGERKSANWEHAIEELRSQLLAMRGQLMIGSLSLSDCLHQFVQFDEQLAGACKIGNTGNDEPEDISKQPLSLNYISETIQVLAEIEAEQRRKLASGGRRAADYDATPRPAVGRGLDEGAATEAIKLHYSYLTQIITAYMLLFNGDNAVQSANEINKLS